MEANVNSMSIKINWHQNLSFGSSKPLFFLYYIPRNTLFEFVFWLVSPTKRILRGYTKVLLWWLNVLLPTSNNNQRNKFWFQRVFSSEKWLTYAFCRENYKIFDNLLKIAIRHGRKNFVCKTNPSCSFSGKAFVMKSSLNKNQRYCL